MTTHENGIVALPLTLTEATRRTLPQMLAPTFAPDGLSPKQVTLGFLQFQTRNGAAYVASDVDVQFLDPAIRLIDVSPDGEITGSLWRLRAAGGVNGRAYSCRVTVDGLYAAQVSVVLSDAVTTAPQYILPLAVFADGERRQLETNLGGPVETAYPLWPI